MILLAAISFGAAVVNGAMGYGFSSIAVPLGLLLLTNRVLNPAIVLLEVPLNTYVAWVHRRAMNGVAPRIAAVVIGIGPGVAFGTIALSRVDPERLKLATYLLMLPLVLLQAAGVRRPVRAERRAGFAFGGFVGAVYAVTTISGPPLAMFLNNQEYAKSQFVAGLGIVRLAESALALSLYAQAGLVTHASLHVLWWMAPATLAGIPLGTALSRRIHEETFRRVCMAFDAGAIAFGVAMLLRALHVVGRSGALLVVLVVLLIDAALLVRYFRAARSARHVAGAAPPMSHAPQPAPIP